MHAKRKQLIYGNCQVLSPNGELMFRCLEKKAYWYLNRNLAEIISNDPLTIKLKFTPKGKGEKNEYLKEIRENKCSVCGNEELEKLTRHHLIPHEYRKHFPKELKSHNSSLVVPICTTCHEIYENTHAIKFKKELMNLYVEKISYKNPPEFKYYTKIKGAINALLKHKNKIPYEKTIEMEKEIMDFANKHNISLNDNISENDLNNIQNLLEKIGRPKVKNNYSKIIVEKCGDLKDFSIQWVKHFIQFMQPKFLPEYLKNL
jgi:hypothetical protein